MTNRNRRLAAVAVAATMSLTVTAAAAAQATAAPAGDEYTLVAVDGKGLPVETEKEGRCREEVTTGTLVLREDSRWYLETSIRETCGERTEMDQESEDGVYRTEGAAIQFLDEDGNRSDEDWDLVREIDLDELDQGSIGDGGTLTVRLADEKTVLRFRRQGV
jgi:hypothetical protein